MSCACHPHGQRDRVRSHCHAADGIDLKLLGLNLLAHQLPTDFSDPGCSVVVEGCDPAVDVEIARLAGREGELPGSN